MLLTQKQQNQPPSSSEKNTNSTPLLPTRTPLPPPSPQPQISKMPPGPGTRGPHAGLEFTSRQAKPTPVTAASRANNNNNNNNNKKIIFNKYELGRLLGCGAFAKVYHARNLKTGQSVAIKCINKLRILKTNLAPNIKREVSIMRRLHHPNVVPIIEVLATRSTIYFVMEFVRGGELFTRLSSSGRFSENLSRSYFRNLISAVAHCHSRGVFHRDLKLENLLLDENGNVKVSDFGLSALNNEQIRPDGLFHTLCGTPAYVAPEVLSKKGYDGAKVDLWSCGVILFVLNAGFLPFNDSNLMQMYRKIYQGEYRIPKWTSPELKRLINRLLDTNPVTRITMEGILKDPWFNKGMNEEEVKTMIIGGLHGGYGDHDAEEYLTSTKVNNVESSEEECDRELNAFDIISFSSGCNLSGLFDRKAERDRFVSYGSPAEIIHKVEEIARIEGFVVRNRKEKVGIGRHGIAVKGQDGNLIAWVDCHRLSPGMVVVEVEKGDLDDHSRWNSGFWKEKLGPASEPTTPMSYHHRAIDMMGCASQPTSPISGNSSEIEIMDSDSEQDFPFPNPENHRSLTM